MTAADGDQDARGHLARHFFSGLFDMGDLSSGGPSSLPRMMAGVCGVFLAMGALLARVFLKKYDLLGDMPAPDAYLQAVVADHAFLIAVPMWVMAFVTVLVSASLFPDETDFRVLMALPVTRRVVFGAKLLALARFLGIFIVASHAAMLLMVVLTAINPWAAHSMPRIFVAWIVPSLLGSAFAVLAVTAIHSILLLAVPRERALPVSAALTSVMLFGLILILPLVGRLAGASAAFQEPPWWLAFVPPAWFAGLEQLMLGDARLIPFALFGGAALAVAGLVAVSAYVVLYRHFDRVILRSGASDWGATANSIVRPPPVRESRRPAAVAVRDFTAITLRRSVLHQGLVVMIAAVGAAVVVNSLSGLDFWPSRASGRLRLEETIAWAPFVLIFTASLAVRAALLVPIELRANWIFRVTDQPVLHRDQLGAAINVVRTLGVLVPVGVMLPLQWLVTGPRAIGMALVTVACGFLFVEMLLAAWRRVPFTCSYIVGKGFVPQMVILGSCAFWLFTTIGTTVALLALPAPGTAILSTLVIVAATLAFRYVRLRSWQAEAIEYEDSLPNEPNALRLSGH